jgi:hypothetical protein
LAKIEVETLPLIGGDGACAFGEVVLEVQEAIQKMFELMKLADVYMISELVEKFDKRGKPFNGGSDFRLEDFDAVCTLNFLEVDENRLRSDGSS